MKAMNVICPISALTAEGMGTLHGPAHPKTNAIDVSKLFWVFHMCYQDLLILGIGRAMGHNSSSCTKENGVCYRCKYKESSLNLVANHAL